MSKVVVNMFTFYCRAVIMQIW